MDDDSFIMSFQPDIRFAVKTPDSGFYKYYGDDFATIIDYTIDAYMYSAFGEINAKPTDYLNFLISGRIDKHEFADPATSSEGF
ncbi:MAG: hypothetical protein P9L91_10655 [Candidatus Zophobacter franzmannii]|jgi:hypothetical protein|nr:hypothetical protein [Candidatus Zophobacter franzmannii]